MSQTSKTFLPLVHMIMSLLVAGILLYFQSFVLAHPSRPWLWLDLLAIYVFYVGLEHHTFSALCKIILVSLAFELHSSVPAGFSLMSHLLIMFVGNRLAVWLEMQQRATQLILFIFLLSIKEILFAATLKAIGLQFEVMPYLSMRLPGAFMTAIVAIPLMEILSWCDGRFESRSDLSSPNTLKSSYSHF